MAQAGGNPPIARGEWFFAITANVGTSSDGVAYSSFLMILSSAAFSDRAVLPAKPFWWDAFVGARMYCRPKM